MKTEQVVKERIELIESEIKYQDGANLYWQKGQLDSLRWVLKDKNPARTLAEMEAEDPDVFKNPR
jgi:hypothetical protein